MSNLGRRGVARAIARACRNVAVFVTPQPRRLFRCRRVADPHDVVVKFAETIEQNAAATGLAPRNRLLSRRLRQSADIYTPAAGMPFCERA